MELPSYQHEQTPSQKPATNEDNHNTSNTDTSCIVELATLVLPAHAAQKGLEAGEGDQVVLEAEKTTVEHIAAAEGGARLTAVVDLEVLSELVGVTEEEFIADLHTEVVENRVFVEEDVKTDQEDEDEALSSGSQREPDEEQQEEPHSSILEPTTQTQEVLSDRVTLAADPFIETLAETLAETTTTVAHTATAMLPTIDEKTPILSVPPEGAEAPTTATIVYEIEAGTTPQEAAATKTDDDQYLGHDAFLLNIPNETSDGTVKDHFVLALPEIRVDTSVSIMSASTLSHQSQHQQHVFPMLQKALAVLPDDLHLPSDVLSIQLEAHADAGTVMSKHDLSVLSSIADGSLLQMEQQQAAPIGLHLDVVVKRRVPVIGYVILISGLVALASVGAALDLQQGPSATMKTLWRQLATSVVLSPLVLKSLWYDGFPDLTKHQWAVLPCAAAAYAYMCTAFVVALQYTTMANAFVLSNMTSLVIILGRFALGLPILKSEGIGAIIGFMGAAVCSNAAPPTDIGSDTSSGMVMLSNTVALSASFATAIYLIFAKSLRSSLDIFVFMFSIMLLGSCFLGLYMAISGEDYSFDMHRDKGLFGWLLWDYDRLPLELFMAIVCNCLGTTGYIAVMKYFEPIVPASVMLMEPVVGSLMGTFAGTAPFPGEQTWIGDFIVAAGTFLVIWSGSKKTEKIEATEALRPSTGDDVSTVVSALKSPMVNKPNANLRKSDEAPSAKVVWES